MASSQRATRQTAADRRRLVDSFERRFERHDPVGAVRRPRSVAVVVHPTADQTELLKEIAWESARCESVDAYFRYGDSVYWVELIGLRIAGRAPGVYYLYDRGHRQDVIKVVLPHALVYSADLQSAFDLIEALVDRGVVQSSRLEFQGNAIRLADPPGPGTADADQLCSELARARGAEDEAVSALKARSER